ncbi:MAG TPA: RNA polymerase sigma factor [Candidatus Limnocylindria bacterium]|nr:RNA polymerase sigma factor [Candidatus Limnocylindria bacterium]
MQTVRDRAGVWLVYGGDRLDIEKAKRGDREAFGRIAERHLADLYRLAAAMVGEDDARDVTQETLVAAWRELPRLRDVERFPAWLRSIHMNRCRNLLRTRRRRPAISHGVDPTAPYLTDERMRDEPISRLHAAWAVDEALERLPADERSVFALHYVSDLTLREVGRTLGIPEGTAKTRLHSGLLRLRSELARGEDEVVA